jgi:hypothetical protein
MAQRLRPRGSRLWEWLVPALIYLDPTVLAHYLQLEVER